MTETGLRRARQEPGPIAGLARDACAGQSREPAALNSFGAGQPAEWGPKECYGLIPVGGRFNLVAGAEFRAATRAGERALVLVLGTRTWRGESLGAPTALEWLRLARPGQFRRTLRDRSPAPLPRSSPVQSSSVRSGGRGLRGLRLISGGSRKVGDWLHAKETSVNQEPIWA